VKQWLKERPWIWIVVFFVAVVLGSLVTVTIAEFHRPLIVKENVDR